VKSIADENERESDKESVVLGRLNEYASQHLTNDYYIEENKNQV
jgi:hypothetical protein